MKKVSIIFMAVIMCTFSFLVGGCNKNDNVIRLNEVTHSIFYAPLYVAINNGYFEEEGIEIELTNGGGADKSMAALTSGSADIALMGPEATIYVVEQGKKDKPVVFAQLTRCDGSFIIGRENKTDFSLEDMEGSEVLAGRKGGVPYMTLAYVLKQHGLIDGRNITLRTDVQFDSMTAAFVGNVGDYVTAFEPSATQIQNNGQGYVLGSVGEFSGDIPYTCFTANESFIEKNEEKIEKFIRAIIKGYNFVMTSEITEIVEAVKPSFTGSTDADLTAGITAYKRINAWSSSPVMTEQSYNNLITIMLDAGELDSIVAFKDVVNNTYAQKVYQEMKTTA